MNQVLNRAILLYHQSRYDLAEQELRRMLAEEPHDARGHALLGLCLAKQEKLDDAQAEVEQAIVLSPDEPYPHYCRSLVLEDRNRFADAEASAREALRLEPGDADYYARLAATLFRQGKWQPTLDACLEGLSHDAEHGPCQNLRAMALTQLGRKGEAVATAEASLARNPDDSMAHANKGWALLHQRQPREALEHFREALRLDPTSAYARQGMVEALKARHLIYRWMLAYFLWMARLDPRARWGVVIGGYFGARVLQSVSQDHPAWAPWLAPLLILYLVFVLLTWFSYPLFNLLLRLNRFGRYALSRDARISANWFGVCLAVFSGGVAVGLYADGDLPFFVAGAALGMALPLVTIYHCANGWPRQMMTLFACAMAGLAALTLVGVAINTEWALQTAQIFIFGFIATPWLANYLAGVTVRR